MRRAGPKRVRRKIAPQIGLQQRKNAENQSSRLPSEEFKVYLPAAGFQNKEKKNLTARRGRAYKRSSVKPVSAGGFMTFQLSQVYSERLAST